MARKKGYATPITTHTHQYHRVTGKFSSIWKCADPDCRHFVYAAQDYIINGRASICWECRDKFVLDEDAMKETEPRCIECRVGARGQSVEEIVQRVETKVGARPRLPIIPLAVDVVEEDKPESEQPHSSECLVYIGGDCTCGAE